MPDRSNLPGLLSHENWIGALPEAVRGEILELMVPRDLLAGDVLIEAGAESVGIYQLDRGYLRLVADHADGRQTLILVYRPGNCFSESPLVAQRRPNHSTVALTDARVRLLPTEDFWRLYHRHPAIPEALCRKFAHNMSRLLIRREIAVTRRLREMVAVVFCNLADACGIQEADGTIVIDLPLTQNDLADHLDVTRQAVQREVAALKSLGVLAKRDGLWRVIDAARLRRLAD
jgi:CRP/FNR family cyclic AMP-dependent transcriptional regulator